VSGFRPLERTAQNIRDVDADFGGEPREFNGQANPVHLLVNVPPAIALSWLVNSLNGVSSRRPWQEFPDLRARYRRAKRLRSVSYFAGSADGAPISVPRQSIQQQNRPA
jgi:putative transposase